MTIVAKSSLTLSNVNDGTITHYAYANSADGKDGFYVGGGTNLLQGTQDFSGSNWVFLATGNWIKTDETYNGLSVVETTNDWNGIAQYYQVKQGETYTFSLFARYTSGTGTSSFYISLNYDPENGYKRAQVNYVILERSLDTNWKKYSITFTATSDGYVRPRMERTHNNTNVLRVCGFMLEEGTVAHPWSPAPSEAHPSYIGQYTDFNTTASTDPAKYAPWIIFKGNDGDMGKSVWSYPYDRGANRVGSWWSDLKPTPTTDNPPKVGDTIIDLVGSVYQITNVVVGGGGGGGGLFDYGPMLTSIKGADGHDGIAGKDGNGIKATVITYAISTSGTTAPTTGWTSSVPTLVKGRYLWTKTVWTYTDNSSETGYSVTYISKDGNNGTNGVAGKDGVGITATTITYAQSTSGTAAPSSGWTPSVPSVPAGQFLWTKTVWRYSDNTSETGYSVAKMGNTGATGPAGPPGSTGAPGKIVSNTEPISLFKGLTWKYSGTANLTASDGTVIHPNTEYYYNGTHWMINYLSANNFEANSITADLIDAKNLTITDGEFVSTIIDGSVKTQTEIKDDHLLIYKMDTSHNDITTIALKSDSGLGMTYQNADTSQYTSSGINLQGIFTQDNILKNGVSLTPGGVKFTQNGVSAGLNFDGTNLSSSMPIQAPNTIVKSTYFSVSGIGIRLDRMMSFVAVTFSGRASSTINNTPTINNVLPVGFRPISPYSIDYMVPGNTANNGYIYFNPDGSIRIMATINSGYYIRGTRLYITNDVYPS
ncbi:hypothetical protein P7H72_13125 [Lactococcus lactis]|nr:hypothetical protein [Lactococcus lactis]MDT2904176.1 hypothetical protein [Lactococcus lactis]